jgi:hypothetical protein
VERHFPPAVCLDLVQLVIPNLVRANALLKPNIVLSSVRLICNGLLTSRRFQAGIAPCKLCGSEDGDDVEHAIHCTSITLPFATAIGGWNGPFFGPRRACLAAVLGDAMLVSACIVNDMTVHAIEVAHLGPLNLPVVEVLRARARAISRHCSGASAAFQSGALRTSVPDRVPIGPDLSDFLLDQSFRE